MEPRSDLTADVEKLGDLLGLTPDGRPSEKTVGKAEVQQAEAIVRSSTSLLSLLSFAEQNAFHEQLDKHNPSQPFFVSQTSYLETILVR